MRKAQPIASTACAVFRWSLGILLATIQLAACSGAEPGVGEQESGREPAPETVLMEAPPLEGVALRDASGQWVDFASLRGKPALLTFIYTRCPMPEMCPATTLRFQQVQEALSQEDRGRVRLLSISFDPAHDTPEVLAEYGELWEVDDNVWKLLTGDQSDILRVASAYGVWYEATDEGTYRHPMYTLVLFPDGSLHEVLLGSTWDADTVAALLRQMADDLEVAPR